MKNSDQYSLTELCFKLDLSPAWVKKIEGYLALKGWGSGQRGKKSYYSAGEFNFFKKVKVLRLLGFGLEKVKALFDMEYAIQNYLYKHYSPSTDDKSHGLKDITGVAPAHVFDVYLTSSIYNKPLSKNFISDTYDSYKKDGKVEADKLEKMHSEYREFIAKVHNAAKVSHDILGQEILELGRVGKTDEKM